MERRLKYSSLPSFVHMNAVHNARAALGPLSTPRGAAGLTYIRLK